MVINKCPGEISLSENSAPSQVVIERRSSGRFEFLFVLPHWTRGLQSDPLVVRDTSSDGTCESLADGAFSIWQEVPVHLQFGAESVAQNLRDTMLILSLKLSRSALLCWISHIKIFFEFTLFL